MNFERKGITLFFRSLKIWVIVLIVSVCAGCSPIVSKRSQVISKPIDKVFYTVTHITEFPKWNPTTVFARKLTEGEIKEGTRFEMDIEGFGKQELVLENYEQNKQVRLVTINSDVFSGGHLFILSPIDDNKTKIDHELVMDPKGFYNLLIPILIFQVDSNLEETADALQTYLDPLEKSDQK